MARIIDAFTQFFDDNGEPLADGFLQFLESGTNNTDKDTFADINELIANTNPLQLDGAGRCPNVFGSGAYNVISYAEDPNSPGNPGQQIQQFDPVSGDQDEGAFADWNSQTIYSEGDIVTGSDGLYYRSIASNNQNQDPATSPGQWEEVQLLGVWNSSVIYSKGDLVLGSDGLLYTSRIDSNSANNPTADDGNWRLLNDDPSLLNNTSFTAAVATKALTFAIKANNQLDPSGANKNVIAFRSATLTSGKYDIVYLGAAASVVVPDGATLGFAATETRFVYLYAIDNAGAVEAGVCGSILDEAVLHTSVAIDATADSGDVLYSTSARTSKAIRLVGRIKIQTGAVAGEWDNAPTELYTGNRTPSIGEKQTCKAWVNMNLTAGGVIRDSYNVSSITDNAAGDFNVNMTNALPDVNYSAVCMSEPGGAACHASGVVQSSMTTSTFQVLSYQTNTTTKVDRSLHCVQVFSS